MPEVEISLALEFRNIERAAEKSLKKTLNSYGAYTRRVAMNSMKRGKKGQVSEPGKPPFYWAKGYKRLIRFAHEPATKTTVVGAVAFSGGLSPVPMLIEYGGMTLYTDKRTGQRRAAHYQARPALRLAMEVVFKKFSDQILKDSIR